MRAKSAKVFDTGSNSTKFPVSNINEYEHLLKADSTGDKYIAWALSLRQMPST